MAASSSSNPPTTKQSSLSYAERARRAGASATPSRAPALTRNPGPNGKTRSGDESTSPASSSRNLTPNSSAALTLSGSPPPSSSQTSVDEPQTIPFIPKSPSKPTQLNVWTARKEQQMARAAVQQHGHASAPVHVENASSQPSSVSANRFPTNGVNPSLQSDEIMNAENDPFVVRMPAHGPGRERAAVSKTFRTPPSLDDSESWPEMGKGSPSVSTSVSSPVVDLDKKEGSSKKGEKPKWVQIPPAELQATHDAIAAQSQANSRAQSQHRRNNQTKSRSRQQSQARSTHSQNRNQGQNQNVIHGLINGSGGAGLKQGDASTAHSRTESTTHSRTTSVHSSPRFPTRGRRLPEDHLPMPNLPSVANAGSSSGSKRPANGHPEEPVLSPPLENQNIAPTYAVFHDNNAAFMAPPQPLSGPHSQSHTPYSHSPVYYPPPSSSGSQGYGYGPVPPGSAYVGPPQPIPSPGMHQQGYMGYPPYVIPQHLPPGQPPFPYMYQPVPYSYYPSQIPLQQQETRPQQGESQQDAVEGATHLSPVLPPTSTLTRPPPPEESAALSGYRAMTTIAVSPLLTASEPGQSISQVTESGGEVLFGSVGQPGGMKSPSPAPLLPSAGNDQDAKILTAFAVGFDGPATIRRKRTASAKDSVDEVAEAVKVIDLTDKGSKWEFGTSAHPEAEGRSSEKESAYGANEQSQAAQIHQEQMDPQILQPQPQHMLHYPPPNGPPTIQIGGYNMAPQMHMMSSLPIPTQSPQGGGQPIASLIPSLAPMPINPGFVSPLTLSSPAPGPGGPMSALHGGDEWEVRDFGYGFGPTSGSGYMPERIREERFERDGYRDSRDNFREPREFGGGFGSGRMRRNSTAGGYGASYYEGSRGGYSGRRGRGQNGYGRGFGRGGFGGRGGHGNFRHQPSLSVSTTFQHQQGMQQHPQMSPEVPNGYYAPPSTATAQFMSSPYGQYNPGLPPPQAQPQPSPLQNLPQSQPSQQAQPPVPMPVTSLSFPLDPLRLYLLGQIEYYFSLQNLASDLFLRKQMDSRGWLPIHLIASFNRVRQLTQDPQLVNEVLNLSSLVEVRGEHVRLSNAQWENFVLPSAATSTVEGEQVVRAQPAAAGAGERETPEEEEEDDVVFVLGGEESRPWTGAS